MCDNNKEVPVICTYYGIPEKASNGIEYNRIFNDGYLPNKDEGCHSVKTHYGYRFGDKQIFIYDFDTNKETLAFDFKLDTGKSFTTVNGMEWLIMEAKDTLVNVSFCGQGDGVYKRLLKVKSKDGLYSDQWLEDFGSFSNHFMITNMDDIKYSHTLWMEYGIGEYLARDINVDPFFAHDSGWMDGTYDDAEHDHAYATCTYRDGKVTFENVQWCFEHRDYCCYYRIDDSIYKLYCWELEPHVDSSPSSLRKDVTTFDGLPTPSNGKYVIYIDNKEYTTGITNTKSNLPANDNVYDLLGRKLSSYPSNCIYIHNGEKILIVR